MINWVFYYFIYADFGCNYVFLGHTLWPYKDDRISSVLPFLKTKQSFYLKSTNKLKI